MQYTAVNLPGGEQRQTELVIAGIGQVVIGSLEDLGFCRVGSRARMAKVALVRLTALCNQLHGRGTTAS